jgi:hypothetical protein
MAEKKTIELEIKTDSVKSLKTQLREAQQEVQVLAEKFGATSREATEAAAKAAKLKDAIGDAKALTDAFNPDAKFNALSGALGGVAGGFSAVQGAMGLFGSESENVQKALLKVQSAMALSQGINSIMGAKDAFTNLAAVIGKTTIGQKLLTAAQVVGAATMRVLNMVMNANPVLLLVTGVTALVGAMALLRSSQEAAAVTAADLNKELEKQQDLTESISKETEVLNKLDLAYARERGASEKELTKIKEKSSQDQINILYKNYIATQKTFDKITSLYHKDKATFEEYNSAKKKEQESYDKWNDAKNAKIVSDAEADADKAEKTREEQAKKQEEANKKAEERRKKAAEAAKKAYDDEVERRKKSTEDILDLETDLLIKKRLDDEKEKERKDKIFEDNIKRAKDETKKMVEINEQDLINKQKHQERVERLRKQDLDLVSNGFKLIGDFTDLMGKRTEKERRRAFKIKKAADLASATIDGTKAVLSTYADTPGGPIIKGVAAGIAGAFSAIQIAKISKQQFDGGGASGGGGGTNSSTPSTPNTSSGVIAPKFNIVGGSANQLNTLQQQPIQAYVVSGDVTSAQSLDRNRIKNATL